MTSGSKSFGLSGVNLPTGVPLVYTFDEKWNVTGKEYLGDSELIRANIQSVADQGKTKKKS